MRMIALATAAALLVTGAAVATPPDAGRTEFEILRNGQPFGRHTIVVTGSGDDFRAQSNVSMRATMGPVTVFRLEQSCVETWTDGALTGFSCNTLKDGRRTQVRAERRDNRLRVSAGRREAWFPGHALPASWLSPPPAGATLINTENGEQMRARVTHVGRETLSVGGRRVQADHIRVRGENISGDLWYDTEGRWIGCTFNARGQRIEYRLAS